VLTKSAYVWCKQENGEHTPVPIAELAKRDFDKDLPHALTEVTFKDGLFVHEKMELGFHPTTELEELFASYTKERL
jgi:hypothetical protein